jgi:hypothetical protein
MTEFLFSYGASILATLTIPVGAALLYSFRDALIRGFWKLSEDHVQKIISSHSAPSKEGQRKEKETLVRYGSEPVLLSTDGRAFEQEFLFHPPHIGDIVIRLVGVGADYVEVQDASEGKQLFPFRNADMIDEENRIFRIKANRRLKRRGKLFAFGEEQSPRGICTVVVHAEDANPEENTATIVPEHFGGKPDNSHPRGLD